MMLHKFFPPTKCALIASTLAVFPTPSIAQSTNWHSNQYGLPGLIDMPTATSMADGDFSATVSNYSNILRNTLSFQVSPRLTASFRYTRIGNYHPNGDPTYDRAFDLRYRLRDETQILPALAIGLRDIGGTGHFAGEYLTATKNLSPRLRVTGGLGWGRLATHGAFRNPLTIFGDSFSTRDKTVGEGGDLDLTQLFHGPAAAFGGIEWQVTDQIGLVAEYSSDAYLREDARGITHQRSPFNFGLNYRHKNGMDLGLYYLHGDTIGLRLNYVLNPKRPGILGGAEAAPTPVKPRSANVASSWGASDVTRSSPTVRAVLAQQGITLKSVQTDGARAIIHIENPTYAAAAQAIGRSARALTHALPAHIETLDIVPTAKGIPLSRVTLQRSDLEELEHAPDGAWQSFVRARVRDAHGMKILPDARTGRDFNLSFGTYLNVSLFDPSNPLRANAGLQLMASYSPTPALHFSGMLRYKLTGNQGDTAYLSDSVLPHVRSDAPIYARQDGAHIPFLTAAYFFRPAANVYGRITAGYLERMYGGISAEILWKKVDKRWAIGAELNAVRQRDFDGGLGFHDYETITGHVSGYFDLGRGYRAQVDAGRYLARDWGATLTLERRFTNGWRVGAFATLTDVPFKDFGEGSSDKGFYFNIPTDWVTGQSSQSGFGQTVRLIQRDGGARVDVRDRLFDIVDGYHQPWLQDRWGRFWR